MRLSTAPPEQDYVYIGTAYKAAYYDGNCVPGVTYYYKVRAVYSANGNQYYSGLSSAASRQFTGALKAPANVKAAAYGARGIRLTWTASPGATQYNIYRYNGAKKTYVYIGTATKPAYYNGSLSYGTTYYYKVRAIRKAGGATYVSGLSASVSAKTKPSIAQLWNQLGRDYWLQYSKNSNHENNALVEFYKENGKYWFAFGWYYSEGVPPEYVVTSSIKGDLDGVVTFTAVCPGHYEYGYTNKWVPEERRTCTFDFTNRAKGQIRYYNPVLGWMTFSYRAPSNR